MVKIFMLDVFASFYVGYKCGHDCELMFVLALCQVIWFVYRLATDSILIVFVFPLRHLVQLPFFYQLLFV